MRSPGVPLSATLTTDCTQALFRGWITRFGVPAVFTSDRGAQFTSAVWCAVYSLLGVDHATTTTYHPEGNGMVERFHRSLKAALRARCSGGDWACVLCHPRRTPFHPHRPFLAHL